MNNALEIDKLPTIYNSIMAKSIIYDFDFEWRENTHSFFLLLSENFAGIHTKNWVHYLWNKTR